MKKLLKSFGITEKQVELIRMVAKHPIFGANAAGVIRVLPAALRSGLIEKVWLDQKMPILRTVTDTIPGTRLTSTSNQWYEPSARAVSFMQALEPGWLYDRPSARFTK